MREIRYLQYEPSGIAESAEEFLAGLQIKKRISYRDLYQAIAEVFASGSRFWRDSDEKWMHAGGKNFAVGYADRKMLAGSPYGEAWVQLTPEVVWMLRDYSADYGIRAYLFDSGSDLLIRASMTQELRRNIVEDMYSGLTSPVIPLPQFAYRTV